METKKCLKKSVKMEQSVLRLQKKFGEMEISFEIERILSNRNGKYYDYAECYCPILQKTWTVSHDGTINPEIKYL